MLHHQAGRLDQAEAGYRAALALEPKSFDALHYLGVVAYQRGRHAQAVDLISQAIAVDGSQAAAHNNLGNAYDALGEAERALACYRAALELAPDYADALANLGVLLGARGEREQAADCYRRALALDPSRPAIHSNLGNILLEQGRRAEAIACYRAALAIEPDFPEALLNLGNALGDAGELDEAIAALSRALELQPGFAEAHANLSSVLVQQGRLEAADAQAGEALRLKPDLPQAQFGRALIKLMQGDYAAGLPLYESRFREKALSRLYATLHSRAARLQGVRAWRGEACASLLVWTDQGLGDSLMMLRYLPLIKARGVRKLSVYCEAPLVRLVQGADEVIPSTEPLPADRHERQCPMMSLPLAFGTTLEAIPSAPYLRVPSSNLLSSVKHPRVGLLWAGGPLYPRNHLRSIRLARLAPVLEVPGASFVSLQKGDEARQLGETRWKIADFMDDCRDLFDTAALVQELDLVIGVDSAVAHLVGALGKPMWMMNRFESEWRWLLGRADSPWYPSMRIYRQPAAGDWDSVVAAVARDLANHDFGIGRH